MTRRWGGDRKSAGPDDHSGAGRHLLTGKGGALQVEFSVTVRPIVRPGEPAPPPRPVQG